ncbi:MAG: RidA family protein [Phycisphaerae bacterium]|nr:RidA family protein [Phycisphaerae bacterium]
MTPSQRLQSLGLSLPPVTKPIGSYVPGTRVGTLVMCSGQLPIKDGQLLAAGKVGRDVTLEVAQAAARRAALNALAVLAEAAGSIDRIARIVRLAVFVNSAAGFFDQPKVANGASDLMVEVFGDGGRHVRAAVGAAELPMNACVEVEVMAEVAAS